MQKKFLLTLMGFFIISIILVGCSGGKKVISGEDFSKALEEQGYTLNDESEENKKLTTSYINASHADTGNTFLFIDFIKEAEAANFFETTHQNLHGIEGNYQHTDNVEKSSGNFQYQELTTEDNFYRIIKVKDTILYLEATIFQKDEVLDIVNKLGY